MRELDDHALLRQYAEQNSEAAFAALVERHVDKVYSVAQRHTRNAHAAEEITQAVFVILAKKSGRLGAKVILAGWLYETARLTALTYIRSEIRRTRREQEAHMQTALNENDEAWPHIAPLLDDALAKLSATDRHAIVLRYFDGKSLGEVGAALGASEDAAKKRVTRAVEKLRGWFTKRGVTLTATVLTAAIAANSVQAAPLGLAATVTAAAAKGAVVSGSTLTLIKGALKIMAWTKMKTAVAVGVGVLLAAGTATVVQVRKHYDPETYLSASDWRLEKFKKAPPLIMLQPTRHPQPKNLTQNGTSYINTAQEIKTGKIAGRHVWLKFVIEQAYGFPENRVVFPSDVESAGMLTNYYDILATTDHPREQLQSEIKRTLGFFGRRETIGTNEMLVVEKVK